MLRAASRVCGQSARYGGATKMVNRCAAPLSTAASPKFTGKLACLDLEGVLIPEVRVASHLTGACA